MKPEVGEKDPEAHCSPLPAKVRWELTNVIFVLFVMGSIALKAASIGVFPWKMDKNESMYERKHSNSLLLLHFSFLCDVVSAFFCYIRRDCIRQWCLDTSEEFDAFCSKPVNTSYCKRVVIVILFCASFFGFATLLILYVNKPRLGKSDVFVGFLVATGVSSFFCGWAFNRHIMSVFE